MMKTTTEGNASGALRRMILVLLVATLMAATMMASAGPALAAKSECKAQFLQETGNFAVVIFKGGEVFKAYTTNRPPPSCTLV